MSGRIRYAACAAIAVPGSQNPINAIMGYLNMTNVTFNDPLRGAGQFSGDIKIKNTDMANRVWQLTSPDQVAIYAVWEPDSTTTKQDAQVLWGGPIEGRTWSRATRTLTISAVQWESFWATRLLTPNVNSNVQQDSTFKYTGVDQFSIVRNLVGLSTGSNSTQNYTGMPSWIFDKPTQLSGVTRTVALLSTSFMNFSDALNQITQQSGGFDVVIGYVLSLNTAGRQIIQPVVYFYYPERQPLNSYTMYLRYQENQDGTVSGNIVDFTYPEDLTSRVSREWIIGNGVNGDAAVRNVLAPNAANFLYKEGQETHSDITDVTKLDQFGRLYTHQFSYGTSIATVVTDANKPDVSSYFTGDRTKLSIHDMWVNADVAAARITERGFSAPQSDNVTVTLSLDVTDNFGPSVEV